MTVEAQIGGAGRREERRPEAPAARWAAGLPAAACLASLAASKLRGRSTLLAVENLAGAEGKALRLARRAALTLSDRVVVAWGEDKEELAEEGLPAGKRVEVAGGGPIWAPRSGIDQCGARLRLGLPPHPAQRLLLFFGSVRPYKGLDVLLRAFSEVLRTGRQPLLVMAGRVGPDWHLYERVIDRRGIRPYLRFFPWAVPLDQAEEFFLAADIVVLPYRHLDGPSGVGALALPFGRPLLVSDLPGLRGLVARRQALVPPANASVLAAAIIRLLDDDALRIEMGADSLRLACALDAGAALAA
jgi:glycosyltransferase involved in cell wall biosynthesis